MLKIKDKSGKLRFILSDDAEEPISVDELILEDARKAEVKKNEKGDRQPFKS